MASDPKTDASLIVPRTRPSLIWLGIAAILIAMALWRFLPLALSPTPAIGGPFALTDTAGHRVTNSELLGKPYAVFFGYTHCPDVCPTTLQDMSGWLKSLGPDADKVRLVFVTVDPDRDTPPVLADYMKSFDPRILALTGSQSDLEKTEAAFRVYAKKGEVKNGEYAMDHTAAIYLMDRSGVFRSVLSLDEKPEAAVARLKELIGAA